MSLKIDPISQQTFTPTNLFLLPEELMWKIFNILVGLTNGMQNITSIGSTCSALQDVSGRFLDDYLPKHAGLQAKVVLNKLKSKKWESHLVSKRKRELPQALNLLAGKPTKIDAKGRSVIQSLSQSALFIFNTGNNIPMRIFNKPHRYEGIFPYQEGFCAVAKDNTVDILKYDKDNELKIKATFPLMIESSFSHQNFVVAGDYIYFYNSGFRIMNLQDRSLRKTEAFDEIFSEFDAFTIYQVTQSKNKQRFMHSYGEYIILKDGPFVATYKVGVNGEPKLLSSRCFKFNEDRSVFTTISRRPMQFVNSGILTTHQWIFNRSQIYSYENLYELKFEFSSYDRLFPIFTLHWDEDLLFSPEYETNILGLAGKPSHFFLDLKTKKNYSAEFNSLLKTYDIKDRILNISFTEASKESSTLVIFSYTGSPAVIAGKKEITRHEIQINWRESPSPAQLSGEGARKFIKMDSPVSSGERNSLSKNQDWRDILLKVYVIFGATVLFLIFLSVCCTAFYAHGYSIATLL